ncbi:MFS transporter [Actinacidiphila sp. ITFR-21]|uniref:MFS transporter n=1 Tax=Actinacidiphila sp. ITFR-21 TaxID=3075199 RepID=UPI002888FBE8|nr:MFS transporter [Streptomyces sp. ITFR-21]WNI18853.1 MFS transporter [Streptomyces sp. ITFR-21]
MFESTAPQGVFAALRVRDYRVYWSTGLVSNTGSAMQGVALDWLVLTVTGSGTAVGWTAGLQFAPVLLFGLWGGVLADRCDRRRLLLVAQSLYAVQALVLAVAVLAGHPPLWLLYTLAFCLGCVFTVENPARLSFVTELVGVRLIPKAAGLNILSLNVARLVGPAVAGVLIGAVGTGWVFAVNAVSFLVVLIGLLSIRPRRRPAPAVRTPWAGAGADGLRYVAQRPELLGAFAIFGMVSTFAVNFPTTMTLFAGRVFDVGAGGLGLMSTALSVGTIAGTIVATRRVAPRVRTVVAGAVLFGASEALTALSPSYLTYLALLVPVGFTLMILNTAVSAFVQTEVRDGVRGRVMAVYTVISMGGTPLGGPVIGWLSQHAGVRWGLAAGGGAAVLSALAVALWLRRRPAAGPLPALSPPRAVAGRTAAPPAASVGRAVAGDRAAAERPAAEPPGGDRLPTRRAGHE